MEESAPEGDDRGGSIDRYLCERWEMFATVGEGSNMGLRGMCQENE